MSIRHCPFYCTLVGAFIAFALALPALAAPRKPNIVFFLVDDLGVMDIGAYNPGTFYETPHVDRLARQGMKFTSGYAANPVCSPTRYSILTGKYPTRVGATNWFSGKREGRFRGAPLNDVMPLEEITLAEALKSLGYRTAFVGKWHLGPNEKYWPEAQGFDINIGGHDRGSPPGGYFAPYKNPRLQNGPPGEHLTARLADEAAAIIEGSKNEPFLLYVAFYSVHTPLQAPQDLVRKYQQKAERLGLGGTPEFADEEQVWLQGGQRKVRTVQKHATYAAMVESMDAAVGKILHKLDALGLAGDTIVCFTSDNGGLSTAEGSPTSNLPLRGGKGWVYEGGIREPFVIKWPGVVRAESVCHAPVMSIDFYPTLLEAAGAQPQTGQIVDGRSLAPLLKGEKSLDRDALYWHYPHYSNQGGFPGGAIRSGNHKLIERYEDGRIHLYDLQRDPGERHDLAMSQPEQVEQLRAKLHNWYRTVDAQFLQAKEDGPQPWRP
jgi:arylsulfatase A-like enzyme